MRVDQVGELFELLAVLGQVGGVGGELVAGQAGVAAVAGLAGREHAQAVGEDPVGAPVQLHHLVDVAGVQVERTAVAVDLRQPQELALVGLGERGGVVHRHLGARVPDVALHDVDGDALVEQVGGLRVPQPVGSLEVDEPALAVADPKLPCERAESHGERVAAVGALAEAVALHHQEQVPGRGVGGQRAAGGTGLRDRLKAAQPVVEVHRCCSRTTFTTARSTRIVFGAPSIFVCW